MKKRLGWILAGNSSVPGSRIHGINIHKYFLERGMSTQIIRMPEGYSEKLMEYEKDILFKKICDLKIDIIVFQKVNGVNAVELCKLLRDKQVKSVFIACDTVDNDMAEHCDMVFAVSSYLKSLFHRNNRIKIRVLNDPIEVSDEYRYRKIIIPKDGRLKAVFLSSAYPDRITQAILALCQDYFDVSIISAPHERNIALVNSYVQNTMEMALQLIREHKSSLALRIYKKIICFLESRWAIRGLDINRDANFRLIEWKLATVYDELIEHHIGLIPIYMDSVFKKSKSINRMATFMALGLPIIASPLPSYLENASDGENILFARDIDKWRFQIKRIDEDRAFALDLAYHARENAWENYSIRPIANKFINYINPL